MPSLFNEEKNSFVSINLLKKSNIDYDSIISEYEKWITFDLHVYSPSFEYRYTKDRDVTLNLFETKKLINEIKNISNIKKDKSFINEINFFLLEGYFELNIRYLFEDDLFYIYFWINMGTLTSGKIQGYDSGIRFCSNFNVIKNFHTDLSKQLKNITIEHNL